MPDVQKAIQAMLKAIHAPGAEAPTNVSRRVVCISRDCGSGGDQVAQLLAKRLGVDLYDRIILDRIGQRLDAEPSTMKALDAGSSGLRDLWLYSLVTGQDLSNNHYNRHLANVIVSLARSGGVVLGRGAHLVLARSGALRVRISGSPEICAKRLAEAEGIGLDAALKKVEEVNRGREQFVSNHFHERLDNPRTFDLVVNTDRLNDFEKVVDMLIEAMGLVGQAMQAARAL